MGLMYSPPGLYSASPAPGPVLASQVMKCPQCGTETPDSEWNCVSCRINVYWASKHFDEMASIRRQHDMPTAAATPPFLLKTHRNAMDDRAGRGGRVEHKVREIARLTMRKKA